jgi:hypothetical protein
MDLIYRLLTLVRHVKSWEEEKQRNLKQATETGAKKT